MLPGTKVQLKNNALDINGEPHPMRGIGATILEVFDESTDCVDAGFDCIVVFDCSQEEAAQRHNCPLDVWMRINEAGKPTSEESFVSLQKV